MQLSQNMTKNKHQNQLKNQAKNRSKDLLEKPLNISTFPYKTISENNQKISRIDI